jgi:hypothetical protein
MPPADRLYSSPGIGAMGWALLLELERLLGIDSEAPGVSAPEAHGTGADAGATAPSIGTRQRDRQVVASLSVPRKA